MNTGRPVVAIDGPAGSGKSSVARRLARRLGLPYLDTGAMYRALGLLAWERGIEPEDSDAAATLAESADIELRIGADQETTLWVDGSPVDERIRRPEVSAVTSRLAVHARVRRRMVEIQRRFVREHGGVLEGRDIGTRVVPDTPWKFYLDAEPRVRAERRRVELSGKGVAVEAEDLAREIAERDARDRARPESPLAAAPDAHAIDTSKLTVEEVVDLLARRIGARAHSHDGAEPRPAEGPKP